MNLLRKLPHTLTRWTVSRDGRGGFTYGTPVQIACRWQDKQEMFQDNYGVDHISKSVIYTAEELNLEDYVVKGTSMDADPTTVDGTYQVRQSGNTTDLRGTRTLYKAFL